jgi:hypothetical protein
MVRAAGLVDSHGRKKKFDRDLLVRRNPKTKPAATTYDFDQDLVNESSASTKNPNDYLGLPLTNGLPVT